MINGNELPLERCPHCGVNRPRLFKVANYDTKNSESKNPRVWYVYQCASCGSLVLTVSLNHTTSIEQTWPAMRSVADAVPDRAREYLTQAIASLHAPAGALMLAASSLDSMLKVKGYTTGSLYSRIDEAAKNHLITEEMAAWAHEVRLDANDQRHADDTADLPSQKDANKAIEFAQALAEFLFVLPARVARGRKSATQP
jgi:DNA-directed RNA polymerase subunit RPC12/RpoP